MSFFDGLGVGWVSAVALALWLQGRRSSRRYSAQDATIVRLRARGRL